MRILCPYHVSYPLCMCVFSILAAPLWAGEGLSYYCGEVQDSDIFYALIVRIFDVGCLIDVVVCLRLLRIIVVVVFVVLFIIAIHCHYFIAVTVLYAIFKTFF